MENGFEQYIRIHTLQIIDLYTGIHFEYDEEIIDLIVDTLDDQHLPRERLLFSGYSIPHPTAEVDKETIFANTLDEFRYGHEYGPTSPLQHAIDSSLTDGGLPVISVYDAKKLRQDSLLPEKYHITSPTADTAHLARFVIH